MAYNLHLLRQRAGEIRENLDLLRAAVVHWEDVNRDVRDASMYRLMVVIEAANAICLHICSRLPTSPPDSMPECFEKLAAGGVCSASLGENLSKMARFRNLLVHRYWQVDDALVGAILRESLDDVEQYLAVVADYLGDSL